MNKEILKRLQSESGSFKTRFCYFIVSPSPFNFKVTPVSMLIDDRDRLFGLTPLPGSSISISNLKELSSIKSAEVFFIDEESSFKLLATSMETIQDLESSHTIRRVNFAKDPKISSLKVIRHTHDHEFKVGIKSEGTSERDIDSLYPLTDNVAICRERMILFDFENDKLLAKMNKTLLEFGTMASKSLLGRDFLEQCLKANHSCRYSLKFVDSGNTSKRPNLIPVVKIFSQSSDAHKFLEIGSKVDAENIKMTEKLEELKSVKIAALTFKYGSIEFTPSEDMKYWFSEKGEFSRRSSIRESDHLKALHLKNGVHILSEKLGIIALEEASLNRLLLSLADIGFDFQTLHKVKGEKLRNSLRKKGSGINWLEGADEEGDVFHHPSNVRSRIQKRFQARSLDPSLKMKNEALSLGAKKSIESIDEDFNSRNPFYKSKLSAIGSNNLGAKKDVLDWYKSQKSIKKYPAQVEGISYLLGMHRSGLGTILADQMGLGKTIQALACMQIEMQRSKNKKKYFLVIAKKTVLSEWSENDAKKIELPILHQYGSGGKFTNYLNSALKTQLSSTVFAITPEFLRRYSKILSKVEFEMIFIDESHEFFSKPDNQTYLAVEKLKRKSLHCLTGSPAPNRIGELFAQVALSNPGLFPEDYAERSDRCEIADSDLALVWKVLMKSRSLDKGDLPKITRKTISMVMPKDLSAYFRNEKNRAFKMTSSGADPNSVGKFLFGIRPKLSCHIPSVKPKGVCPKAQKAYEIVTDQLKRRRKTIVFSEYIHSQKQLSILLEKSGISHTIINGNVSSQITRRKILTEFNSGKMEVLILAKKVAGSGLNIQGAQTVVLLEPFWNLATDDQCIARAYRRGQTKAVETYSLFYKDSSEEQVIEIQKMKKKTVNNGLNPAALIGDTPDSMLKQVELRLKESFA